MRGDRGRGATDKRERERVRKSTAISPHSCRPLTVSDGETGGRGRVCHRVSGGARGQVSIQTPDRFEANKKKGKKKMSTRCEISASLSTTVLQR